MCGAGLELNQTTYNRNDEHMPQQLNLLLGASPDAVVRYPNGTLEALEVKNHCPFVNARRRRTNTTNKNTDDDFVIRNMDLTPSVPAAYIPQLMMEMLCLGPACSSVLMVRQTATNGAVILRLRRDDHWLQEMIYWLQRFVSDYVNTGQSPPSDFFWQDERYKKFIQYTKQIGNTHVELVDYVKHSSIQRVLASNKNEMLPLFLDSS